jgi:hypothetical protein
MMAGIQRFMVMVATILVLVRLWMGRLRQVLVFQNLIVRSHLLLDSN